MRFHQEGGKEPGIMAIGKASELKSLADNLLSALQTSPEVSSDQFPPHLYSVNFQDGEKASNFFLSFNLETERADLPKQRTSGLTILWVAVFVLAMLGVFQIFSWAR